MTISKASPSTLTIALAFTAALGGCSVMESTTRPAGTEQVAGQPATTLKEDQRQKEKVQSLLSALNSYDTTRAGALLHPDYIQHNPFIPTGRDALLGLFSVLKENNTQVSTQRLIQDGRYVVAHNLWSNAMPFGAQEVVTFDVFRFDEDGTIAEHWDALMPNTPPNPSGRGLTDGSSKIIDIDKTAANKAVAAQIFDALVNGTPEQVGAVVNQNFLPDYKQHSPTVADGIAAIFEAFGVQEWNYKQTHKIIGEGNFVLAISEGTAKGVHSAFYDLLRFENGKVAEHWDVIQAIPVEGLANDNGMFGFQ